MTTHDADDDNNDTRWTEHDCIGSLPNEPKTWCPFKKENHETKCFPKKNCVLRSCDRCGVNKVNVSIPTGINQYKQVHYDQWVYKNRDEKYKMMNDGKHNHLRKYVRNILTS